MISTTLTGLFILAVFAVRWAIRCARRRRLAADPFSHPFGDVAFIDPARPANRTDQGSGGNGKQPLRGRRCPHPSQETTP